MRTPSLCLVLGLAFGGCTTSASISDDDSMYLTGSEEEAVRNANGVPVCDNPKKVLICHIPPGNPDNAHSICVSENAVDKHQSQHGDGVGACGVPVPPPPPPPGDGDGDGGGTGGGGDTPPIP